MNYHDIKKCDMLNGDGLRVVLFVSGCGHHCLGCQNPETWDTKSGILFNDSAKEEIFTELNKDYVSGLTLSGGDPLNDSNLDDILKLVREVKAKFPERTIWVYTGYTYEELYADDAGPDFEKRQEILAYCDVLVDGRFDKEKLDVGYPFAGSINQRIIHLKGKV